MSSNKDKEKKKSESTMHAKDVDEVLKEQSVDPEKGLNADEVEKRRKKHGENVLPTKERTSAIKLFLKQFKDFLILILFLAAAISFYAEQMANGYIILAVILFNAIMGFVQEYRAEKAVEAIKSMVKHKIVVLRHGEKKTVLAKEVVIGDIVILEEGENVPADGRLIKAKSLRTGEASLTGESEPVQKDTEKLDKDTNIADQKNMVWKGTHVVKGMGRAVVTAVGEDTEIGKIAESLQRMEKTQSNFRKKTSKLAKKMAGIAVFTSLIVLSIGYFYRNFEFQEILLVTIATMVSSIPEGLPVVISIVLAIGANRMAQRNAIIREFTATEMLGSVTTILTDKTGTITRSVITVRKLFGANGKQYEVTGQGHELQGKLLHEEAPVDVKDADSHLLNMLLIARYGNNARVKDRQKENGAHNQETGGNGDKKAPDRIAESRSRIDEDLRRLKEDIKASDKGEKAIKEDEEYLQQDIERFKADVRDELSLKDKESDENGEQGFQGGTVEVSGDPTEVALRVLGEKSGLAQLDVFNDVKTLDDIPFNSEQKFRAKLVQYKDEKKVMLVMGAPERIMELSSSAYSENGSGKLDEDFKEEIEQRNGAWADEALRVISLGHKEIDKDSITVDDVDDLLWTGMVGMIDPPRPQVKEAIANCKRAGIRVIMVTGDHAKTAAAIAKEVGILHTANGEEENDYPPALSEKDVAEADDEKLDDMLRHVSVFARVNPNTKLRIAERLQKSGELIAMTGDGVNDAPALKKADVGIAMGKKGTDVAKDAAQIVLSDDNFASIVNAIREGRIVFKNIRSTCYFLLTTNFAATATLIFALLLGFPIPLTAVQILWVNMVTDGIMDVAKATEPGHGEMMDREPIGKDEPILQWEVVPHLIIMAAIMVGFALFTLDYYMPRGIETARTGVFFMIAMTQVFNAFNMRDLDKSVFTIGVFSNKWINRAFVASIVLQLIVVKIPWLQDLFGFAEIAYVDFLVMVIASSTVLWAGELYKWVKRRYGKG